MNKHPLVRKTAVLLCTVVLSLNVAAQNNTVFGKVGDQIIDQDFMSMMQLLNPEFGFTPNKESFSKQLLKYYVLNKANADDARSKKQNEDPAIKKNIELIRQLAEDKYLASLKGKPEANADYTVSDAEAKNYYFAHVQMFIIPGQYSYFTANIGDTIKYPAADIKKKMKEFATLVNDEFKTGDKESYSIIFTKNRSVSSYDDEYAALSKLKAGDFAERLNGERKLIYLLMNKTAEVAQPFDKVKETCFGNLLNEKRVKGNDDFIEKAKQKYPVDLTSGLFKH